MQSLKQVKDAEIKKLKQTQEKQIKEKDDELKVLRESEE